MIEITALDVAKTSFWAVMNKKYFTPTLKKLTTLAKKGKINILVMGASGVGKTTLGQFMGNEKSPKPPKQTYVVSSDKEEFSFQGEIWGEINVLSGQNFSSEWKPYLQDLEHGKVDCLIYVVSGGYHSLRSSDEKEFLELYGSLENYTVKKRNEEVRIFKEFIAPRLIQLDKKILLLTLVLKQDLWFDKQEVIKDFYVNGEYNVSLEEIKRNNPHKFFTETVFMSLQNENLRFGRDYIASLTAAGYDIWEQAKGFEDFEESLKRVVQLKRN
jgi:energy-coupling factor transporter ATP-binding protein EcfA2